MIYLPSDFGEPSEIPYLISPVAGLQFYDYDERDELRGGLIRPVSGDRIELVRQPDNYAHRNAVEVRFRNGSLQLGHLPRFLADDLAPLMDAGKHLRAYAITSGNGDAWSVKIMVCGEGIPAHRHATSAGKTVRLLDEELARDPREEGRLGRAKATQQALMKHRQSRLSGAVETLCLALAKDDLADWQAPAPLPEYTAQSYEGREFGWWDDIPGAEDDCPQFRTKTQWQEAGYKLKRGVKAHVASIQYGKNRRWRRYFLYSVAQVEPKSPPKLEAIAKGLWLAISTAPAKAEKRKKEREYYARQRWLNSEDDYDPDWMWNAP